VEEGKKIETKRREREASFLFPPFLLEHSKNNAGVANRSDLLECSISTSNLIILLEKSVY